MKFLNDTCTFINKIISPESLFSIVDYYRKNSDEFYVTDCIMDELLTMGSIDDAQGKIAITIFNALKICESKNKVDIININDNETYSNNLKNIRKNYYGHLYDRLTLKSYIDAGTYTRAQAKNLYKKDMGECSCVAIAMEDSSNYIIVTEDGGKIKLKQNTNIFKIFEKLHNVRVWNYYQWADETKYNKSKTAKRLRAR